MKKSRQITKFGFWGRRDQKGQSLVEFALVIPVMILLFMGMFDFGWILHRQIQLDNATRLGARRGAVGDTNASIISQMQAASTFPIATDEITIEVHNPDGTLLGDNNDRTPDNMIHVEVTFEDIDLITPLGNLMTGWTSIDLHSESEFMIE